MVETIVAATYAVLATQTAAALPTATFTPPPTFTPTSTSPPPTQTLTPTPTFIFLLYTLTPGSALTPSPSPTGDGSGSGGATAEPAKYVCQFVSQTPENGSTFAPNEDFDWKWTVRNVGSKDWYKDTAMYMYITGDEFHKKDAYQLGDNTSVGSTAKLIVHMKAPKSPGSYLTTWAMRKGKYVFCYISFQIIVK